MADENDSYVVWRHGHSEADVVRYAKESGELVEKSRHVVKSGMCDCEGFGFRKDCKHLKVMSEPIVGVAVDLIEARAILAKLAQEFGTQARRPEEPFERDASGMVVALNLDVLGPKPLFFEGTRQGVKLKIRMLTAWETSNEPR